MLDYFRLGKRNLNFQFTRIGIWSSWQNSKSNTFVELLERVVAGFSWINVDWHLWFLDCSSGLLCFICISINPSNSVKLEAKYKNWTISWVKDNDSFSGYFQIPYYTIMISKPNYWRNLGLICFLSLIWQFQCRRFQFFDLEKLDVDIKLKENLKVSKWSGGFRESGKCFLVPFLE